MEAANQKLEYSRLSLEDRLAYDKYVDIRRSNRSSLYTAKLEGRAEGKAEGKTERNKEVAKNMKTKGLDVALISEMTGLSAEEIAGL